MKLAFTRLVTRRFGNSQGGMTRPGKLTRRRLKFRLVTCPRKTRSEKVGNLGLELQKDSLRASCIKRGLLTVEFTEPKNGETVPAGGELKLMSAIGDPYCG